MKLRDRRKLETSQLIQRTALELARETDADIDVISVEAICRRAGISQRTFFNYFPYKEAAFVLPPPLFPDAAVATFLSGNGPLLDLLVDLLVAQVLSLAPERWMVEVSRRITADHPKIAALQFAEFHKFEDDFAVLIARRLAMKQPDTLCRLIAAALLGALRVVLDLNPKATPAKIAKSIKTDLRRLSALTREMAGSRRSATNRNRRMESTS